MFGGQVITGLLIPFIGTSAGAACVFFIKRDFSRNVQRALTGFAAGVMVAASIWSLLIPAIEQESGMGKWSFAPAVIGFWAGVLFLLLLDSVIPHLHMNADKAEGPNSKLKRTTMMVLAVTLHNIPEGMAVGVVYAGLISGNASIRTILVTAIMAMVLSFIGPFSTFLATIPACVMGGVCIALYGFIAVSGLKMIQSTDLGDNRNLFVVSVILIAGIGGLQLTIRKVTLTSVACALILGILVNIVVNIGNKKKADSLNAPVEEAPADKE